MTSEETILAELLGENWRAAFESGAGAELARHRNPAIGSLLNSERGVFYVQVLYRLLLFRREHELEPLHDDLHEAVRGAQAAAAGGAPYGDDLFNQDIRQLRDWGLIEERIERERLRGYRDARKRKFRYRLKPETMAFLLWLEERLQDDLEAKANDARNLLEEVVGTLKELLRLLHKFHLAQAGEPEARRVLYQLAKLDALTVEINVVLGDFNARLLLFMQRTYDAVESRQVLREIEQYLDGFLRQTYRLRQELLPDLEAAGQDKHVAKIRRCEEIMETERRQAPHLLQGPRNRLQPSLLPARLLPFYTDDGVLDQLCHRINTVSLEVWKKLQAHLRELERKNHRLEDLRDRLAELAALPQETVPHQFLRELLSPARMLADMHFWDDQEKADPPQPRRATDRRTREVRSYLPPKAGGDAPVQSLDEARLERLRAWIEAQVEPGRPAMEVPVSCGTYGEFADLPRILELAKAGIFGDGRRLARIQRRLTVQQPQTEAAVAVAAHRLRFSEMILRKAD